MTKERPRRVLRPGDGPRAVFALAENAKRELHFRNVNGLQDDDDDDNASAHESYIEDDDVLPPHHAPLHSLRSAENFNDGGKSLRHAALGCVKEGVFECAVRALCLANAMSIWEGEEAQQFPPEQSAWHVSFNTFKAVVEKTSAAGRMFEAVQVLRVLASEFERRQRMFSSASPQVAPEPGPAAAAPAAALRVNEHVFAVVVSACVSAVRERAAASSTRVRSPLIRGGNENAGGGAAGDAAVETMGLAIQAKDLMEKCGLTPSPKVFAMLIQGCGHLGDSERVVQLLNEMKKKGVTPDLVALNVAVDALVQCGQWQRAKAVVDDMKRHALRRRQAWAQHQAADGNSAPSRHALEASLPAPDARTYNILIKGLQSGTKGGRRKGRKGSSGSRSDLSATMKSIGGSEETPFQVALKLREEMVQLSRDLYPEPELSLTSSSSSSSSTTTTSTSTTTTTTTTHRAAKALKRESAALVPDAVTGNSLVSCALRSSSKGTATTNKGTTNKGSASFGPGHAGRARFGSGGLKAALLLLDEAEAKADREARNKERGTTSSSKGASSTSARPGQQQQRYWQQLASVARFMGVEGYTDVVAFLTDQRQEEEEEEEEGKIGGGGGGDDDRVRGHSEEVEAAASRSSSSPVWRRSTPCDVTAAAEVLARMRRRGVPPNEVTYTAIVNGCAKHGKMEQAWAVFESMRLSSIASTSSSCSSSSKSTAVVAAPTPERHAPRPSTPPRVPPPGQSPQAAQKSLPQAKNQEPRAQDSIASRKANSGSGGGRGRGDAPSIRPNTVTYNAMILGECRSRKATLSALASIDAVESMEPDEVFGQPQRRGGGGAEGFSGGAGGFGGGDDGLGKAWKLLDDMLNEGVEPDTGTMNALLEGLLFCSDTGRPRRQPGATAGATANSPFSPTSSSSSASLSLVGNLFSLEKPVLAPAPGTLQRAPEDLGLEKAKELFQSMLALPAFAQEGQGGGGGGGGGEEEEGRGDEESGERSLVAQRAREAAAKAGADGFSFALVISGFGARGMLDEAREVFAAAGGWPTPALPRPPQQQQQPQMLYSDAGSLSVPSSLRTSPSPPRGGRREGPSSGSAVVSGTDAGQFGSDVSVLNSFLKACVRCGSVREAITVLRHASVTALSPEAAAPPPPPVSARASSESQALSEAKLSASASEPTSTSSAALAAATEAAASAARALSEIEQDREPRGFPSLEPSAGNTATAAATAKDGPSSAPLNSSFASTRAQGGQEDGKRVEERLGAREVGRPFYVESSDVESLFEKHGWNEVDSGFNLFFDEKGGNSPKKTMEKKQQGSLSLPAESPAESFQRVLPSLHVAAPDLASYSMVIEALVMSSNPLGAERALALYKEMRRDHKIIPDEALVASVFSAITSSALSRDKAHRGRSAAWTAPPRAPPSTKATNAAASGSSSSSSSATVLSLRAVCADLRRPRGLGGVGWSEQKVRALRLPALHALRVTTSEAWREEEEEENEDEKGAKTGSGGSWGGGGGRLLNLAPSASLGEVERLLDSEGFEWRGSKKNHHQATGQGVDAGRHGKEPLVFTHWWESGREELSAIPSGRFGESALFEKHGWNEVDSGFRFFLP